MWLTKYSCHYWTINNNRIMFLFHFEFTLNLSIILLYWMLILLIGMLCTSYSMMYVFHGPSICTKKQIDGPPKLMKIISWPILISSGRSKQLLYDRSIRGLLYRSFSLTWSVAPVGWWNNTKYLNKKELIPVPYTNMAAISLFWYTNMAAVTSDENDL
jgi:hypothetical protein